MSLKSKALRGALAAVLAVGMVPAAALGAFATPADGADDGTLGKQPAVASMEGQAAEEVPSAADAAVAFEDQAESADAAAAEAGKEAVGDEGEETEAPAPSEIGSAERPLADGIYALTFDVAGNPALSIGSGSHADNARAISWSNYGGQEQKWRILYDGNGFYSITNVRSGRMLGIANADLNRGAPLEQYHWIDSDAQKWKIRANGDGTFRIGSKMAPGVVDLTDASPQPGTAVRMWSYNGSAAQRLRIEATDILTPGFYNIISYQGGLAAGVVGGYRTPGAYVELGCGTRSTVQKWKVSKNADGYYTFEDMGTGTFLSLFTAGAKDKVNMSADKDNPAAQWTVAMDTIGGMTLANRNGMVLNVGGSFSAGTLLEAAAPALSQNQSFILNGTDPLTPGDYMIQPVSNMNLAVSMGSEEGAGIWGRLASADHKSGQVVRIAKTYDGYYAIMLPLTMMNFDVENGSSADGAALRQWPSGDYDAQKWTLEYVSGKGAFVLRNRASGTVMDLAGGAAVEGNRVLMWNRYATDGQLFTFTPSTYVPPLPPVWQNMLNRVSGMSSRTDWLIACDYSNCIVGVFRGGTGNWRLDKRWDCSPGALSSPTVRGVFTVSGRGYSFGTSSYTCYYYTQFYGNYLFHSILYHAGTRNVLDGRLGMHLSHGCVRLDIDNAYYLYANCPSGSTVYVY